MHENKPHRRAEAAEEGEFERRRVMNAVEMKGLTKYYGKSREMQNVWDKCKKYYKTF